MITCWRKKSHRSKWKGRSGRTPTLDKECGRNLLESLDKRQTSLAASKWNNSLYCRCEAREVAVFFVCVVCLCFVREYVQYQNLFQTISINYRHFQFPSTRIFKELTFNVWTDIKTGKKSVPPLRAKAAVWMKVSWHTRDSDSGLGTYTWHRF